MPTPQSLRPPQAEESQARLSQASDFSLSGYLSEPSSPDAFTSARSPTSELVRRRSTSSQGSVGDGTTSSAAGLHAQRVAWDGRGHRVSASASSSADIGANKLGLYDADAATDDARFNVLSASHPPRMSSQHDPPARWRYDAVALGPDVSRPTLQPSESQVSLDGVAESTVEEHDQAHLTTNMPFMPNHARFDEEAPTPRRARASLARSPRSPLGRHGSVLDNAARSLRRASVRVVNLASRNAAENAGRIRLVDAPEEMIASSPLPVDPSPLYGKSLGIFTPQNRLRLLARSWLLWPWTEPIILFLIILNFVVVAVQTAPNVFRSPLPTGSGYFRSWEDWVLFALFVVFTLEMFARILVSGLIFGEKRHYRDIVASAPFLPESLRRKAAKSEAYEMNEKTHYGDDFANGGPATLHVPPYKAEQAPPPSPKPVPASFEHNIPFRQTVAQQQYITAAHTAYLRHSWNRIDFVAVVSFWITFLLASFGWEETDDIHVFRMLSVLRIIRLLTITSGTTTILHSFKRAAPQLASVALFILFAMVLFGIIGVQGFKGSLRRTCVWIDPAGQQNWTFNGQSDSNVQHCGGQLDANGIATGYIQANTQLPASGSKGFLCPEGQLCVEGENPYNNTIGFDNFFVASMMVVVVASANTWTDIMYDMMDADFFASCLYFIVCLLILNFWLLNTFVAVITNTFGTLSEQSKQSAFTHKQIRPAINTTGEAWTSGQAGTERKSTLAKWWARTNLFWAALILVDMAFQASRRSTMTANELNVLQKLELGFTLALDVEIVVRFLVALPDWRHFWMQDNNIVDAFLALITSIIQIPPIVNSAAYPWLTVFQIARTYRVILAVPRMERVLKRLWSSLAGLINMIGFLLLMTFIAGLMGAQFWRGEIPEVDSLGNDIEMSFYQTFNSFLGMFQIFSSENWTSVLYPALGNETATYRVVITAIYLCAWMLFAYFILLQMFIAVINEGWAVAEEQKHKEQLQAFVNRTAPQSANTSWISRLNPYRLTKPRPKVLAVENIPNNLVLPMRKTVVRDVVKGQKEGEEAVAKPADEPNGPALRRLLNMRTQSNLADKRMSIFSRRTSVAAEQTPEGDDLDRQLDLLALGGDGVDEDDQAAAKERRAVQADFITAHPSYDRSLWIFPNTNPVRRFCQKMVDPPYEERIYGAAPIRRWTLIFRGCVFAAVVGSIVIAAIATPVYRRAYFIDHGDIRLTWFNLTEVALGMLFIVEFLIKVVADGFIFAPNAYLLSIWNGLDFFVLLTLIVNVVTALVGGAGINRFTRAINAFRALRLINLSDRMRETFYTVFIAGFGHILDACIVAVLYIIPFAIWGQNLFAGQLYSCNDENAANKLDCQGEYISSPLMNDFLAPRVWANPYVWSYDSFRHALLIMFEIISLEGWINVLGSLMWINGTDQQPVQDASQFNAIYLVIYMVVGASVILTLFVSVIIENFTKRSGMSLLTAEQREWIDLRKLLVRQRPAKRPKRRPEAGLRSWCYDRAVDKKGWWSRMMTVIYLLHILLLISQSDSNSPLVEKLRNYAFLVLTVIYTVDVGVRLTGLGWASFSANWWHLYDVVIVTGTIATTLPILLGSSSQAAIQLQKLFLVGIAFKLVQKSDSLNQLFKVTAGSLPAIGNLFLLWSVLFITYSLLYIEVFGLTRWENYETWTKNYATFGNALVMLIMASTGEGWNGYMHDYTVALPRCTESFNFLFSDCGSPAWSFLLAITWNVISMYIFTNMFTAVVVENFSSIQNKPKTITREEMRQFKRVWGEIDVSRSGYIRRKDYGAFFSRLTGVFEVKIYPESQRVSALLQAARRGGQPAYDPPRSPSARSPLPSFAPTSEVDIPSLNAAISQIDRTVIAERRRRYSRLYYEAILSDDPRRGMSFNHMLLLLAHYTLIDDDKALQLDELLPRKARKQRVEDVVALDRVRGLLRTIHWRKRFLRHLEEQRGGAEVPAIFVSADTTAPPPSGTTRGLKLDLSDLRNQAPSPVSPQLTPHSPSESPGAGGHASVFWGAAASPRSSSAEPETSGGMWDDSFAQALAEEEDEH